MKTTDEDNGPVGQLCQIVSGDEDGPTCGWSFNVGDGRIVYAGEITNRAFAELDPDQQAALGGKPVGWFLIIYWPDRHEVFAKAKDEAAAQALVATLGATLYAGHLWRQEDREGARAALAAADHAANAAP